MASDKTAKNYKLGPRHCRMLDQMVRDKGRAEVDFVRDGIELRHAQHERERREKRAQAAPAAPAANDHDAAA